MWKPAEAMTAAVRMCINISVNAVTSAASFPLLQLFQPDDPDSNILKYPKIVKNPAKPPSMSRGFCTGIDGSI